MYARTEMTPGLSTPSVIDFGRAREREAAPSTAPEGIEELRDRGRR
jgi:hypothetical protein